MNAEELKNLLENSSNKFSVFEDRSILAQYNLKLSQLLNLINEFLTDKEKEKLFELEHVKKLSSHIKSSIIKLISDDKIKFGFIENSDMISEFSDDEIKSIVETLGDYGKMQILHKPEFLERYNIKNYQLNKMIKSLGDESKQKLLEDKKFIQEDLNLEQYDISELIASLNDEKLKLDNIDAYQLSKNQIVNVLKTFSDESKQTYLLENKFEFNKYDLQSICATLSIETLVNFIKENKEFFVKNEISPYQVIRSIEDKKQLEIIQNLENMELDIAEKRKILATLKPKTKASIDTSNFPLEYISAIEMQINDDIKEISAFGKIIIDFDKDLEEYRGLDELIAINPMKISNEDKAKLLQLCEICPEINVIDEIGLSPSTSREYREAEIWIDSILEKMNTEWSDIQKIAYVDNAIGRKISYTPDFDTEVCNAEHARALWKIISSGYGVCNGIAQVEKYILSKIGIESEMISSGRHAFLKLKDIEIPNREGGVTVGDTILDPTWNLTAHRYGARPDNFCVSYDEIRKHDIRSDGKDLECHRNDEALASATLNLDEKCLRQIFTSIGVADKDGQFPIKELISESENIDKLGLPEDQSLNKQLSLISKYCPEFATCQNSTTSVLESTILQQENLKFNKCVVNRVYSKDDESKRPVLYVYADLPQSGKKFYFADKELGKFVELSQKEFEERFECYEMDIEKYDGHRPWEEVEIKENLEDLTRSSGKVIASEGDER